MRTFAVATVFLLLLMGQAPNVLAQAEPIVGVRAAGMAGAFVGVADDASATYWNPAGLASGAFFSLVLDRSEIRPSDLLAAPRGSASLVAIGTPPFGASYYRIAMPVAPAIAGTPAGRNTGSLETLVTSQFGVTVDQSLHDGVAVGATLKAVRGTTPLESRTAFDADLGVMLSGQAGRAGLSVRNAFEPEFMTSSGPVRLERRIRGGFSVSIRNMVRLAADSDFTTADVAGGAWRDAAVGAEAQPFSWGWVRGGVHWNTAGGDLGAAPVACVGGSGAVYGSLMVDAQVSAGSKKGNRGWGVGLRYNF